MVQLNFIQRLQIANQKAYSNFDTRRAHHDFYHSNIDFRIDFRTYCVIMTQRK